MKRDVLGHSKTSAADDAGHVRAVAVAVPAAVPVTDHVKFRRGATPEFSVGGADSRVNHVHVNAAAVSRVAVDAVAR